MAFFFLVIVPRPPSCFVLKAVTTLLTFHATTITLPLSTETEYPVFIFGVSIFVLRILEGFSRRDLSIPTVWTSTANYSSLSSTLLQ